MLCGVFALNCSSFAIYRFDSTTGGSLSERSPNTGSVANFVIPNGWAVGCRLNDSHFQLARAKQFAANQFSSRRVPRRNIPKMRERKMPNRPRERERICNHFCFLFSSLCASHREHHPFGGGGSGGGGVSTALDAAVRHVGFCIVCVCFCISVPDRSVRVYGWANCVKRVFPRMHADFATQGK